jgi:hypothetical protein
MPIWLFLALAVLAGVALYLAAVLLAGASLLVVLVIGGSICAIRAAIFGDARPEAEQVIPPVAPVVVEPDPVVARLKAELNAQLAIEQALDY